VSHRGPEIHSRSQEIEHAASRWLERAALGSMTENDIEAFEDWKSQALAHRVAYVRLEAAWQRTERLAALRKPMLDRSAASKDLSLTRNVKHVAAFAAMLLVGAGLIFETQRPRDIRYTTDIGNREIVSLADGSHIELNTNSSVRVKLSDSRREVILDKGEAYFDVAHDAARPFSVTASGHRITDIGTKFSVRQDADKVEVSLIEGKAKIDLSASAPLRRSEMLLPGDIAIATADRITVHKLSVRSMSDQLGWRRGVIVFDNTPLAAAVEEVNRYNRTKLVIADPAVSHLTISGTFPADNFQIVVDAAKDVYGLRAENRGDAIVITR